MPNKPKFDSTINLGHIMTVLSLLIAGFVGMAKVQVSIAELSVEIQHVGAQMAKNENKIESLEARIRILEAKSYSVKP